MMSFSDTGPPLSEAELALLEAEVGTRFPEEYRNFLLSTNGGRPSRNIIQIDGLPGGGETDLDYIFAVGGRFETCDIRWNLKSNVQSVPAGLLPIGTDSGGALFLLNLSGDRRGQISFQDSGNSFYSKQSDIGKLFAVAGSFDDFLNRLKNST